MVHRKPVGDIGPITVLGGQGLDWQKIRFPDDKVGQEAKITSLFVQAIYRSDGTKFETTSLPEADHDARLTLGETEIDLQLMEIVIPSKKKSPYRSEKRLYDAGYFADQIISQIQRKKYASGARALWLLLYPTHWAFVPAPPVEFLFHKYFLEHASPYARVFLMHLLTETHGELTGLHPDITGQRTDAIRTYTNVAMARAQPFILADPGAARDIPGGISFPI